MNLNPALEMLSKIDENNFFKGFNKIFTESFHEDDLKYWCDVTGIEFEKAKANLNSQNWKSLGWNIYIYRQIETLDDLKRISNLYKLSKKDLLQKIISITKLRGGDLNLVSNEIPLTSILIYTLLSLQDELIPLGSHWLPVMDLPDSVLKVSKFCYFQKTGWDELIVSLFLKEDRPLKLEEIIYKSLGITIASNEVRLLFVFMLNMLSASKIRDTEYWILEEWESKVDSNLVCGLNSLLKEEGILAVSEINNALPSYSETDIRALLSFWPEFKKDGTDSFRLNVSPLNENLLAYIVPSLLAKLSGNKEGIKVADLFNYALKIVVPLGMSFNSGDFKLFLKSWGEVSIIGNRVYKIESAPYNQMRLGDVAYLILKDFGSPMPYTELVEEIRNKRDYSASVSSVLLTEPKLSRPSRGYWALKDWGLLEYDPQIHLRIGNVLVSIIETINRPVHKAEIHQQLRRKGMNMNATTLYLDLIENEEIVQVARGVYSLKKWNLSFRDLFRYKFPFKLALPDSNPDIYEVEDGTMIEYFISKQCLDLKRLLLKRYILEYFDELEQYARYQITDSEESVFEGWLDCLDDGRFQILGLERWYETYKPRYGESIYVFIPKVFKNTFSLLTEDQVDLKLYGS